MYWSVAYGPLMRALALTHFFILIHRAEGKYHTVTLELFSIGRFWLVGLVGQKIVVGIPY